MKTSSVRKITVFAALTVSVFVSSVKADEKKPNIIFVFADQLRSHAVGCYGNDQLNTPNIDKLASEGVRFTNAISTAPVCGPYRGMLMSGNFPMKNGLVLTDHYLRNPTPYFAEVCKAAGYQTAYVGKWHLSGKGRKVYIPPEKRCGFDFWRALECTHSYFDSKYYHQDEKKTRTWQSYDAIAQTDEACQYIATAKSDDPFCLFLSWGPPHDPYEAPAKYHERFKDKKIRMRENVNDFATAEKMWRESDTTVARDGMRRARLKNKAELSDKKCNTRFLNDYRGYYAAIEALDDCLGKIMTQLQKSGQLDNTILVFTSDHGDNLGSHRQIGKQLPFEESISVPLIIRYPEKIKAGTVTDALFAPVDIMPTLLSLAGVPCPKVDGKDISPAAMGKDTDVQDAVLIMKLLALSTNWIVNGNGAWRGVRTKRYTYARKSFTKKPWMLFDNKNDPFQTKNLVDDPAYADLLKKLDKKTNQLLIAAGDPEDPAVYAKLVQKERDAHGDWNRWKQLLPKRIKPGSEFGY
jgi:arylsulfatase A-like enzyme